MVAEEEQLRPARRNRIAVWTIAGLFGALGTILAIGGAWLAIVGGSIYYLLAGAGLITSAFLIFRGNRWGIWLYVLIFSLTVVWALWEAGTEPWSLVPRLVGPAILLALLALLSPLLGSRNSWRTGCSRRIRRVGISRPGDLGHCAGPARHSASRLS